MTQSQTSDALSEHAPSAQGATRCLRWRGMVLHHPAAWELARHGIGPSGSLQLVEGMTPRMSLEWAACRAAPDLERLRQDAVSEALDAARQQAVSEASDAADNTNASPAEPGLTWDAWEEGPWLGLRLSPGGAQPDTCRLVRYDTAAKRLIELAWTQQSGSPQRPAAVASAVEGFELLDGDDAARRLTAFGLDVRWPVGWELAEAKARVGDVVLTFLPMKGHHHRARWVRVRRRHAGADTDRWGWLDGWRGWSWSGEPTSNGVRTATTRISWRRKRGLAARAWRAEGQPALIRVEAEGAGRHVDRLREAARSFEAQAVATATPRATPTDADGTAGPVGMGETSTSSPRVADTIALSGPPGSETNPLVVANGGVHCNESSSGVILTVPVRYPWWLRGPAQRLFRLRDHRQLQLDRTGSTVWRAVREPREGRPLSELCRHVAEAEQISPREAELSVCRFVQTLTDRGLVRLVGLDAPSSPATDTP